MSTLATIAAEAPHATSATAPASGLTTLAALLATMPRIGTPWPGQGGIFVGLMRGEAGAPDYALIAAAEDRQGLPWGGYGSRQEGADHDRDGLANTRALIGSGHAHPAAAYAAGLHIDGHADFYLPSREELRLCYTNAREAFDEAWYWSSTQCSARTAWGQWFVDGGQYYFGKSYEGRARAVRRLVIGSLINS